MKKFIDISSGVIYFILFVLYFAGVFHAFKKHDDGLLTVFVFPWGWYRGAEILWHDDYAGVDWEKRLNNDVKACYYFYNKYMEKDANIYELNRQMDEFSGTLSKYPKEKLDILKTASQDYYYYIDYFLKDVVEFLNSPNNNIKFAFSKKTVEYENKYKNNLSNEEAEIFSKSIKKLVDNMQYLDGDKESLELQEFDFKKDQLNIKFKEAYKNIFNEEFIQ